MHIPPVWVNAKSDGRAPDGRRLPVSVWGWGNDDGSARKEAANRLQRLLARIGRGEPFPDKYGYGSRPLREEILEIFESEVPDQPAAIRTRNSYGVQVMNTARLLFLDIDLQPIPFFERLFRRLRSGRDTSEEQVLTRLRSGLQSSERTTFRVYRTASGFRVMAIDREFDPAGLDARELMKATGTDPAFTRLCVAQRSFRARLTPKPWRCDIPLPPGEHPRLDDEARRRFASWLTEYEKASTGYATCRYVETVGTARPGGLAGRLVELHDRVTRCSETLPLA
jgi:hypothetical protein